MVGSLFVFTYVPQLAVMVFVNGPLAVFTTVLLILSESATIVSFAARNYLLKDALLDTFDGTLVARGAIAVVASGRELNEARPGGDAIQRLGRALKKPFSRLDLNEVVRYFMYLPLNFIPGMIMILPRRARTMYPKEG